MSSLVPPDWVGCLRRFGLKTVIDFVHFDLESVMDFEGSMNLFIVLIPDEYERKRNVRVRNGF